MRWGDYWHSLWQSEPTQEIQEARQALLLKVCLTGVLSVLVLMVISLINYEGASTGLAVALGSGVLTAFGFLTSAVLARRGKLHQAAFFGGVFLAVSVSVGEILLQSYSDRLWYTLAGIILVGFALHERLIWFAFVCISICIWIVPLCMPGYAIGMGQYPTIVLDVFIFLFVVTMLLAGNARVTTLAQRRAQERLEALKRSNIEAEQARGAAEVASNTKSMFLANMTHELRTPLTSILGYAELIVEESMEEPFFHDELGYIQHAAEHLLSLINDVLDISKIESGRIQVHPEQVNIPEFCRALDATIRPLCDRHGCPLEVYIAPGIQDFVTDRVRLRQVLLNLLSNAAKFSRGARIDLRVTRTRDQSLQFEVCDQGPGIAPEALHRIFDTFVQASSGDEGTGLGLPISRKLCVLMQGNLVARSEVGHGATFTVTLPPLPLHIEDTSDLQPATPVIREAFVDS